jgi:endonuclease/exonuclease/phosphatase family metal-dependent hydrolase
VSEVVEVRILSYNVRSLRDDRQALTEIIRTVQPDVACIQEAPRFLRWRSECARLARESGLLVVTGGRTAGGVLLLANLRTAVLSSRDVLFVKHEGLHQRGLAMAVVDVNGAQFGVASMHLGLDADERRGHVEEVLKYLDELGASRLVLAGDVNETAEHLTWRRLADRFVDGYERAPVGDGITFSSQNPRRRIDAVFVDPSIEVVSCGVPDLPNLEIASDHRPLLAVLRIPRGGGEPASGE